MNNPRTAVLILGYNDEKNINEAISSSINQTYENYQVIYIDNASTDASLSFVRKNYLDIKIVANKKNLGYAGAYAEILTETFKKDFSCAVLLNSDTIVDKNWLSELVASAYKDESIAIAQSKIFLSGENWALANTFGNKINYLGFGFCGHYKKIDNENFNHDQEIISASGASLLVKKDAYLKIGGLDEKFFAYLEDQDLSWRAQMQGYKIVLSAKSVMWHKYVFQKNARNHWKFFTLERNRLFFLFKNFEIKTLILIAPMFFLMEIGILGDATTKGYLWDKIRSYGAFFSNIGMLRRDRQMIQQGRQLTDSELFEKLSPTVDFEEIQSPALSIANKILSAYYTLIKSLV
jgi:GT2 family glycosyltransferase